MSSFYYLRRLFQLPPRVSARKTSEFVAYRWRRNVRKIRDRFTRDPLSDETFSSRVRERHGTADSARLFRSVEAVLPVTSTGFPQLSKEVTNRVMLEAARTLDHRFDILGSGDVRVTYASSAAGVEGHRYDHAPGQAAAAAQRERMEDLLPGSSDGYEPIDWARDFKSGFRWSDSHIADLSYGQRAGVDIKVPWELSRFHDVGALGMAWRVDRAAPPGSVGPAEFRSRVVDWIAANRLRHGPNWLCGMDVAIRAVNWLVGVGLMEGAEALDAEFRMLLAKSLDSHGRHLESHLEYSPRIAGNHYLANVVGVLCIGAALPELKDSDRWLLWGIQELVSEMGRQVRPDGGDFEGSTGYHFLVSELFLLGTAVAIRTPSIRRERLSATGPAPMAHATAPGLRPRGERTFSIDDDAIFPEWYLDRLLAMAEFASTVTKPDGRIPLVGDHDSGRLYELTPGDIRDRRSVLAVAGRLFDREDLSREGSAYEPDARLIVGEAFVDLQPGIRAAPRHVERIGPLELRRETGIAIVRTPEMYLLTSFATVAKGGSGGHYHNDLLSFELQWGRVDWVVDPGTYLYTPVPELRDAWRVTAAHNTIHISEREQRAWPADRRALFEISRDARVEILDVQPDSLGVRCSYEGSIHERTWSWAAGRLSIRDRVEVGDATVEPELVMNLAPEIEVSRPDAADRCRVRLVAPGAALEIRMEGVREIGIEDGFYSPGYGERQSTRRLVAALTSERALTELLLGRP